MPDTVAPLTGLSVLVTRPEHQASAMRALIEIVGGKSILFPVLEIVDPDDLGPIQDTIRQLDKFDIAIFISPNAAEKALNLVRKTRQWPKTLSVAAVGKGSARTLKNLGILPDIFPSTKFNSEALLEMPQMQDVAGKKIVIFRGEGGRELLAETLKSRGAEVIYAECYKRGKPKGDVSALMRAWARGGIDIITVTSNEGLSNLYDMVGQLGRHWLQKTPLVVVSERAEVLAKELGFKSDIIIAPQASDDAIVESIIKWHEQAQQRK
ncbi:MAG: uroporphyrinogen-III synthase [Gammaproteobacteria bacterium]|nr:uroporphyrinogen-III synthase [Gammaproteobacteria bacterium]